MKKLLMMSLVIMVIFSGIGVNLAFADDDAPGVTGCGAVEVDPSASLEFQQSVCNAAEHESTSSCGASGHGTCSSPKLNNTMPDGTHCLCISETSEEVTDEEPVA